MTVQMVTKDVPDIYVLYGGPKLLSPNQTKDVMESIESVMQRDYNGDGDKCAELISVLIMTDEQLKENDTLYNSNTIQKNKSTFLANLYAGDSVICLIDPEQYESLGDDGFRKLSDIMGEENVPENLYDEYALYLKDTKFAQFFSAMSVFPDDTLICARVYTNISKIRLNNKTEENYNNQIDMFRTILTFDFPEGYISDSGEGVQSESSLGMAETEELSSETPE